MAPQIGVEGPGAREQMSVGRRSVARRYGVQQHPRSIVEEVGIDRLLDDADPVQECLGPLSFGRKARENASDFFGRPGRGHDRAVFDHPFENRTRASAEHNAQDDVGVDSENRRGRARGPRALLGVLDGLRMSLGAALSQEPIDRLVLLG